MPSNWNLENLTFKLDICSLKASTQKNFKVFFLNNAKDFLPKHLQTFMTLKLKLTFSLQISDYRFPGIFSWETKEIHAFKVK